MKDYSNAPRPKPRSSKEYTFGLNGVLLIVEDDPISQKMLKALLGKFYKIHTASNGIEALEKIEDGLKPQVILSDQVMPEMTGDEFLARTIPLLPDTVRAIITAHHEPKSIIKTINNAHAYMFIAKPYENIELVQAINLCFREHEKLLSAKKVQSDLESRRNQVQLLEEEKLRLEEETAEIRRESEEIKEEQSHYQGQIIQSLLTLSILSEKGFFTKHTPNVVKITESLCDSLNYSKALKLAAARVAMLHHLTMIDMPEKFLFVDPEDLEEEDQEEFFIYFEQGLHAISQIEFLRDSAKLLSQLWEHADGSGLPNKLKDEAIHPITHIVSIANRYHNQVYRMSQEQYESLKKQEQVSLAPAESAHAHKQAMKYFYRRARWFDVDVFDAFKFLVQDKECESLISPRETLVVVSREFKKKKPETKPQEEETIITKSEDDSEDEFDKMKEKEISLDELESGMITSHNIVTKNGILVARQNSTVTDRLIENMRDFARTGQLRNSITILIPNEE